MSFGLVELLELRTMYRKLRIDSDITDLLPLVQQFTGVEIDHEFVANLQRRIIGVAHDPRATVEEWVNNGGLMRLLASGGSDNPVEYAESTVICPHCEGPIILTN